MLARAAAAALAKQNSDALDRSERRTAHITRLLAESVAREAGLTLMASEVAVTLCAAYPEVDVSVVHLILAEAGGDAGVAAAQLAVLAGESRPRCVALLCTSCLARCLHDTLWSKPASRRRARRTMKWRSRCSSHVRPASVE